MQDQPVGTAQPSDETSQWPAQTTQPTEATAQTPPETTQPVDKHAEQLAAQPKPERKRLVRWIEVFTAVMLGIVAVATAWSGYQSARWAGRQSLLFVEASGLRVDSARLSTLAGQDRLYDVNLFDGWLAANSAGDTTLAHIYEKRFRPEFIPAFTAWLATDPFHNPSAPPGPLFMPQYQLSQATKAAQLDAQASAIFDKGQQATGHSEDYVLNTVFLAMVLFLTAVSERFEWSAVRIGVLVLAAAMLCLGLFNLLALPVLL